MKLEALRLVSVRDSGSLHEGTVRVPAPADEVADAPRVVAYHVDVVATGNHWPLSRRFALSVDAEQSSTEVPRVPIAFAFAASLEEAREVAERLIARDARGA